MKLSEIPEGEIAWTEIKLRAIVTSNHRIYVAPLGTPDPTSYPPDRAWLWANRPEPYPDNLADIGAAYLHSENQS